MPDSNQAMLCYKWASPIYNRRHRRRITPTKNTISNASIRMVFFVGVAWLVTIALLKLERTCIQLIIVSSGGDEFVVGATFYDLSMVKYHDNV